MPVRDQDTSPVGEQRERARGARGGAGESVPARAKRTFTAAEKLRIVKRADACLASGKRGALEAMLREEGIYSSMLSAWRRLLGASGVSGLDPRKVGRKPKLDTSERRNAELLKRNAELERQLHVATVLLDLQKKAHELLGVVLPPNDGES
jgi:transposase